MPHFTIGEISQVIGTAGRMKSEPGYPRVEFWEVKVVRIFSTE